MLLVPAGNYTLEEALNITRSQTVLRGESRDTTTLYMPKSEPPGCLV